MEYNKDIFSKVNDKKVLHKVKKQWVVMSMAMLAFLGGGAVAHKMSAHADVTNQGNTATLKSRLNSNLQKTTLNNQTNRSQNQLLTNHTSPRSANNGRPTTVGMINQQANALHNRILQNVSFSNEHNVNFNNNSRQMRLNTPTTLSQVDPSNELDSKNPVGSVGSVNQVAQLASDFDTVDTSQNLDQLNGLISSAKIGSAQNGTWGGCNVTYYSDGHQGNGVGDIMIVDNGTFNGSNVQQMPIDNSGQWHVYFNPNGISNSSSLSGLFENDKQLRSISLCGLQLNTSMDDTFQSDPNLKYVDLNQRHPITAPEMNSLFQNDKALEGVYLDGFLNTSNVSHSHMFQGDSSLHSFLRTPIYSNHNHDQSGNSLGNGEKGNDVKSVLYPNGTFRMYSNGQQGIYSQNGGYFLPSSSGIGNPLSDYTTQSLYNSDVADEYLSDVYVTGGMNDQFANQTSMKFFHINNCNFTQAGPGGPYDGFFSDDPNLQMIQIKNTPGLNWNNCNGDSWNLVDSGYGPTYSPTGQSLNSSKNYWFDFTKYASDLQKYNLDQSASKLGFQLPYPNNQNKPNQLDSKYTDITQIANGDKWMNAADMPEVHYNMQIPVQLRIHKRQANHEGPYLRTVYTTYPIQGIVNDSVIIHIGMGQFKLNNYTSTEADHNAVVSVAVYANHYTDNGNGDHWVNSSNGAPDPSGTVNDPTLVVNMEPDSNTMQDKFTYVYSDNGQDTPVNSFTKSGMIFDPFSFSDKLQDFPNLPSGYYALPKSDQSSPYPSYIYDGRSYVIKVAPTTESVPVIFYQSDNKQNVVPHKDKTVLKGKVGEQLNINNYVNNELPSGSEITPWDAAQIQTDLSNYRVNQNLNQDGLTGGSVDPATQNFETGTGTVKPIYVPVVSRNKVNAPISVKFINSNGSVQKTASDQPNVQTVNVPLSDYEDIDTGFATPTESNYTLVNTNNFKAKLHSTDPEWTWDTNAFSAHPEAESANYTNGDNWDSTKDRPMLVFKAGDASNINLNYINQSGQPIDYGTNVNKAQYGISDSPYNHVINDTINGRGRRGDHLNVLNPNRVTPYSFNGYPNPDPNDYTVDNSQIDNDYAFTNHQQNVTVPLIGKSTRNQSNGNNAVRVNIYTGNSRGSDFQQNGHPKYTTTVHLNGQIGSFINFGPSDLLNQKNSDGNNNQLYYGNLKDSNGSDINLAHYVADPPHADNSNQQYYLHGNGDQSATLYNTSGMIPTASAENPSPATVNFYYDASPNYSSDVRPITVKYIDQHKNQISSNIIYPTPSDYGQEINVISSDSKLNAQNGKSAQGMSVPSGYHLVDNPDVNYQITNRPQEVDLHVKGNPTRINNGETNDSLPIHIVANVYQSDGTTPDKSTQDTVSDGQGHLESFKTSVSDVIHPQLAGNVGDSRVIDASSYQPRISSNQMVESTGTNKYTVRFKQPQPNQSDISVDGVSNPTSNGITFNYKIVDKPTARQRNYIHYISYSDVNNRGDITTQPNRKAFPTKVSDASDSGHTFTDKYYRENVPAGYQFYKVYSVNGNTNDRQISGGLTQFGNGKKGSQSGPGEEYIEVIPNASPITFHYINQNGSDVKDVQVSGNGNQKNAASGESDYTSNFGTKITSNQINKSDQPTSQLGVPQGYQYNALKDSQGKSTTIGEAQPVFGRDPQNVYIPVTGKTYNKVNVQLQQDFSGTNHQKFANSDYIYTINNAQVGHNYTIYGVNLKTPNAAAGSGYTLNQSGHPFKVTVHINPDSSYSFLNPSDDAGGRAETSNNNGSDSDTISVNNISDIKNNNEISFDGNGNSTNPPKASFWYHVSNNISKPLTLIYINQAGQQVGCADKMQGTVGSDINVTDPDQGGEPLPADYTLDGGITPNKTSSDKLITPQNSNSKKDYSSDVTGTNQDTQYSFTNQPQTVYLHVTGDTHTTNITVYTVAKNSDGTTTFGHQTGKVTGSDGSLVSVDPADYYPDEVNDQTKNGSKSKYSIDYSKDVTQFVRLTRDQSGQVVATPNRIIFYYSNTTTDGAPITLRYINHKTGQEVGYTKVINGNLNDKVDVASSDPTNGDLAGEDVPAGYTIDTNSDDLPQSNLQNKTDLKSGSSNHPVYKFSNSPQMLNIPVNGVPKTLTYHIHVFKESSDGTIQGPASDVALHITGNVGDTIHISPYGFTSSNAGNNGSDIKSMSDKSVSDNKVNNKSISSYGVPTGGSGYHATNTDLDKDIQINANGQLSPDSNTNYFYRQNYQGQQVGTVRIHYITGTVNGSTTFDNTGAPTDDAKQVDMVSDKGTVGNDYTHAGTFDLAPYRDDIPEELSTNYESADNAMNKDGTQIADNPSGNQWQYSENKNGFTNGIRDVYIQVKQRGTNGVSNGPIIIGSDGNMLNQ